MRVAMQFMAQNLSDEPVATEEEYLALVHHYLQGVEPGAHVHAFLIVMDSVHKSWSLEMQITLQGY